MTTVTIELTLEQILSAIERLPLEQKVMLKDKLEAELREQVSRQFDEALSTIRAANRGVTEDEVMADVAQAIREVRAARRSTDRG
ncbi:MAG: hypothetical protein ACE5MB_03255 [Anaerolineae bacterium]